MNLSLRRSKCPYGCEGLVFYREPTKGSVAISTRRRLLRTASLHVRTHKGIYSRHFIPRTKALSAMTFALIFIVIYWFLKGYSYILSTNS